MNPESQNVTDYTNNNTIFMVWIFKENLETRDAFNRLYDFSTAKTGTMFFVPSFNMLDAFSS